MNKPVTPSTNEISINVRVPEAVEELLKNAKRATGASMKYLVIEALRSKYGKFSTEKKAA